MQPRVLAFRVLAAAPVQLLCLLWLLLRWLVVGRRSVPLLLPLLLLLLPTLIGHVLLPGHLILLSHMDSTDESGHEAQR